ncbi:hypothetical protein OIU79_015334 [Salix purpurea]|uniref:Serine decarboxylase n=1 Tax=Salix purpurea TaxID=77065 RepID=A0A9Q0SPS4_SALPP|nr:hypothetical protein OIU79_015334 [Salix purpurea]
MVLWGSCNISPSTILVTRSLRVTMVYIQDNLKLVFLTGLHVFGRLRKVNTGATSLIVARKGIFMGILVGREVFPDGILYASRDSHYSVFKAARMYRMDCVKVDCLVSGEIDCADFKVKLLANKDKPAIINVNIGTTVKGAVDDLDLVIQTLEESGFSQDRFYIHCDGALFGLMMPFVKRAPKVTFQKPIGSVSVSGHKFMGCPMPCGVQLTRMKHINVLSSNVEYLASRDATIMGSRNGHAPIFLWYTLNRKGYKGFQKEVQKCLRNAYYLKDRLRDAGH